MKVIDERATEEAPEVCKACNGNGQGHVQPNGIIDDCEQCWGTGTTRPVTPEYPEGSEK
jgi:DnaJ-class molecular chaperone